jgi:hypothetical protein
MSWTPACELWISLKSSKLCQNFQYPPRWKGFQMFSSFNML